MEIVIAEYQAPGLELQGVDFTNTTKPSDGESSRLVSTTDESVLEFKNKGALPPDPPPSKIPFVTS